MLLISDNKESNKLPKSGKIVSESNNMPLNPKQFGKQIPTMNKRTYYLDSRDPSRLVGLKAV
jgi:hypothetical protein